MPFDATGDDGGDGDGPEWPMCPLCGDPLMRFEALGMVGDKPSGSVVLWICDPCGQEWPEDG